MVLPSGLVLLRTVMVVETEHHAPGLLGRRPQVDGGLSAPGPDLHKGGPLERRTGPECGQVQGLTFVVGHETRGQPGPGEELLATQRPLRVVGGRKCRRGTIHS